MRLSRVLPCSVAAPSQNVWEVARVRETVLASSAIEQAARYAEPRWRGSKALEGCGLGTGLSARLSPEGLSVTWGARRRETGGSGLWAWPRDQHGPRAGSGLAELDLVPAREGACVEPGGVVACGLEEWSRAGCTVQPPGRDRYPRWNGRSRAACTQWN